jgi:hypothetical protein
MASVGAVIDFKRNQVVVPARSRVPRVYNVLPAAHKSLSIFSGGQDGRSPQAREREALYTYLWPLGQTASFVNILLYHAFCEIVLCGVLDKPEPIVWPGIHAACL